MQSEAVSDKAGEPADYDVVIIGGGPGGLTAALYTARAGLSTLVLDKGGRTGALASTDLIANYPGVPDILGAELARVMREQAMGFGAVVAVEQAVGLLPGAGVKRVFTSLREIRARAVLIATGALDRKSRVKGEEALLGRGVSYCATCDAPFFKGRPVALVGNDDHAAEEALFVARFASEVHFAVPTSTPRVSPGAWAELAGHARVRAHLGWRLAELAGASTLEEARFETPEGPQALKVPGAFLLLNGAAPTTGFLQGLLDTQESGCLVVDREFRTSQPGVYAVGDVLCDHVKQVVVAAGEGCIAALAIDRDLRGRAKIMVDYH